jgi:hypothetical protein
MRRASSSWSRPPLNCKPLSGRWRKHGGEPLRWPGLACPLRRWTRPPTASCGAIDAAGTHEAALQSETESRAPGQAVGERPSPPSSNDPCRGPSAARARLAHGNNTQEGDYSRRHHSTKLTCPSVNRSSPRNGKTLILSYPPALACGGTAKMWTANPAGGTKGAGTVWVASSVLASR